MRFIDTFIYSDHKGIRISRHVLFWTTDFLSYLVVISANTQISAAIIIGLLTRVPLVICVTYFIMYYLIPKYSTDRNRWGLALWILAILVFIGVGLRYYRYYVITPILEPESVIPPDVFAFSRIIGEIFSWMAVMCMAIAIKLIKTKNKLQQQNEELLTAKRNAELSFLKAQMHPHFLFNTLNTLYAEAIKTGNRSEQIVLRLSNLMRFILEECNKPMITLNMEIKVIEDYVELEKIRHGSRLEVDFKCEVRDPNILISPLLLLPFVENSFKHTLSSQPGVIPIKIRVNMEGGYIHLMVENDVTRYAQPTAPDLGLGINNVRKQLELLFDKNFKLDISEGDKYIVNLSVPANHTHEH
jgi:two-component system LytT family sensor kinase